MALSRAPGSSDSILASVCRIRGRKRRWSCVRLTRVEYELTLTAAMRISTNVRAMIRCNMAHSVMLYEQHILSEKERSALLGIEESGLVGRGPRRKEAASIVRMNYAAEPLYPSGNTSAVFCEANR